jgi:hypothetical protein
VEVRLGIVGKGRGYGQKCPFFFLPSLPIQTGEGAERPWLAATGGAPGAVAAGDRGKQRGGRGLFIPALTLVRDRSWRWLPRRGRRPAMVLGGGGAWRLGRSGGSVGAV